MSRPFAADSFTLNGNDLNIIGGNIYVNGLIYTSGSATGSFVTTGQTGAILDATVVRTFGAQGISGTKIFYTGIMVRNADYTVADFTASQLYGSNGTPSIDWSGKQLLNAVGVALDWNNGYAKNPFGVTTFDWTNKVLSGQSWRTNTIASGTGDIVNKNYFDQNIPYFDLNRSIDKRIFGLTGSSGQKAIYTVQDHSTPSYLRNTGCWAYDVDLTSISVWNSDGGVQKGGILVSPRSRDCDLSQPELFLWVFFYVFCRTIT